MNSKKMARVVAIILVVVLLLSLIVGAISSVTSALAVTQEEIDELKAQAEELAEKKAKLAEEKASVEYENMETLEKKAILDEQSQITKDEIKNTEDTIARYEEMITDKENDLAEAKKAEEHQWELYKIRLRAMEEGGFVSYISVIFEADSFADFLARVDFIGEVMKYDEQVYQNLCTARERTAEAKTVLETTKAEHEAQKQKLIEKKAEFDAQIEEANLLIQQQEDDIESYKNFIDEVEAAEADLDSLIEQRMAEYEAQLEAERLAREAAEAAQSDGGGNGVWGGEAYGTGTFIWPSTDTNVVTSVFGGRYHPLYGYYTSHGGIDIGASYGTSILASDGGTVIIAEPHWSFGNFVMIDHGNGYTTLYGHMSEILVYAGQYVSQGDVIGLVGSTGESTGPHIHFEIRLDGSRIDPLGFFSGYVVCE